MTLPKYVTCHLKTHFYFLRLVGKSFCDYFKTLISLDTKFANMLIILSLFRRVLASVNFTNLILSSLYLPIFAIHFVFSVLQCHNIECSLYGANNKKSKDTQRTVDVLMA